MSNTGFRSRRFTRTSWQARLGSKMDAIKAKTHDNLFLLASHPTDMIRIQSKRDPRSGDLSSRTIVARDVLPVILPILKDVPLRRFIKEGESTTITSLSPLDNKNLFEAYCPLENNLRRDDLLFRIIRTGESSEPYLMVLQVKDELGTFSYSSLLYMKYKLSYFDEQLPQKIVDTLIEFAEKREELKW
jgi:hypothetical protein